MNYKELEERPYIDSFHYIEYLGEKIEDRKLIKINRFLQEERKKKDLEIERLNNIIKEVREYIKEYGNLYCLKHKQFKEYRQYKVLLEILDKEKIIYGDNLKVEWYEESILDKGE